MASENERQETLAEIEEELRSGEYAPLADRIEAAWKREKAIHAMTCEANERLREHLEIALENDNRESVGNAAAMREALVAVKKSIDGIGESSLDCDPSILMASLTQVCARLSARIEQALSAPPRNCDVGTANEQSKRMEKEICSKHHGCVRCPIHSAKYSDCSLKWAQMPYEAEGGAE